MKIVENKMDLFKLPQEYALVHCISEDCAMGAGIATIFNKKFKDMKKELTKTIIVNNLSYPLTIAYFEESQVVFNMVTKERYYNKPTYKNFEKSLDELVHLCEKYNISKLGMPKIGCGLDKLEWDRVKPMIEEKFHNMDIEIVVCYL